MAATIPPISSIFRMYSIAFSSIPSVSCSTKNEPPNGSMVLATPDSSAMICWVRNATVTHNFVHHNHSVGLWVDNNNRGVLVRGNVVSDNAAEAWPPDPANPVTLPDGSVGGTAVNVAINDQETITGASTGFANGTEILTYEATVTPTH